MTTPTHKTLYLAGRAVGKTHEAKLEAEARAAVDAWLDSLERLFPPEHRTVEELWHEMRRDLRGETR